MILSVAGGNGGGGVCGWDVTSNNGQEAQAVRKEPTRQAPCAGQISTVGGGHGMARGRAMRPSLYEGVQPNQKEGDVAPYVNWVTYPLQRERDMAQPEREEDTARLVGGGHS